MKQRIEIWMEENQRARQRRGRRQIENPARMGFRNGEGDLLGEVPAAVSSMDALLLATICAVGLPVEVQAKDGSLYTGVFHTASVDDGYGIVLKKARMMKKGRCNSNLELGAVVDTLVVLSSDLVQLIVKDFLLPTDGITADSVGDSVREGIDSVDSRCINAASCNVDVIQQKLSVSIIGNSEVQEMQHVESFMESLDNQHTDLPNGICREEVQEHSLKASCTVQEGQVEIKARGHANSCSQIDDEACSTNKVIYEARQSTPSLASISNSSTTSRSASPNLLASQENPVCSTFKKLVIPSGERCSTHVSHPTIEDGPDSERTNNISRDMLSNGHISTNLISSSSLASISNSTTTSQSASPNLPASQENPVCSTLKKEFKLNPEAKVFRPSFISARSASAVTPNVVNTNYASSIPPEVPVAATPTSFEFSSLPSYTPLPTKFVQYNPLVAGQNGISTQYPQPVMGHVNARQQPVRFSGPHHLVHSGAPYMHPNTQPVLVGRTGQLVYVHSLPQEPMPGNAVLSQAFPVLTPFQANIPKVEGTPAQSMQFCMPQPLITGAPVQPFAMASPIPFSPSVPPIQPIAVPGGNGFYGSKFH